MFKVFSRLELLGRIQPLKGLNSSYEALRSASTRVGNFFMVSVGLKGLGLGICYVLEGS